MKKHSFPELRQKHPHLAGRMVHEGKLSPNQMWIELPDNFDFDKPAIISSSQAHNRPLAIGSQITRKNHRNPRANPARTRRQLHPRHRHLDRCRIPHHFPRRLHHPRRHLRAVRRHAGTRPPAASLGKCAHKTCGCTKMKRYLATAKCPLNHWPPVATPSTSLLSRLLDRLQSKTARTFKRLASLIPRP